MSSDIRADPSDLPLTIEGQLGQTDFRTSIRLEARSASIPKLRFLADDLVSTADPRVSIRRSEIRLDGELSLQPNDATDAVIVVSGAPRAGSYIGDVEFYAPGRRTHGLVLSLTLVVSPRPEPTDRIEVESSTLTIEARIGQESSFSDTFVLNSSGRSIPGFQLFAGNLKSSDGQVTLPRSSVEVVGGSKELPEGEYVAIEIKVKGITKPGVYSGPLLFVARGQPRERGTSVTLVVNARGVPTLTLADASASGTSIKLIHCRICALESRIGLSKEREPEDLLFDTPPGVPVSITSSVVTAQGEETGEKLTADVTFGENIGDTITVTLTARPQEIRADQYKGRLKLTLEGGDSPVIVPVGFAVKDGPLLAFGVLLLGILAALAFRAWTRTNDRRREHEAIDRVLARAQYEAPDDWQKVEPAITRARAAIERGESDVASEILKAVGKRIDVLVATRLIEQRFPQYASDLAHVRDLVQTEDDAGANDALTAIRRRIAPANQPTPPAPPPTPDGSSSPVMKSMNDLDLLNTTIDGLSEASTHSDQAVALTRGRIGRLSRSAAYYLSGVNDRTAALYRRTLAGALRFIVGLATLIVAALLAFQAQYINGSETFGTDNWDYFALLVAGFTAGVTQKAVANAKAKPA